MAQAYKEGGSYAAFATTSSLLQTFINYAGIRPRGAGAGSQLRESIARTAHGLDVAGVLRIRLYLGAYVLDVDVGCPRLAEEVPVPEVAHDLLSAVDPTGVGGQERQDLELLGGEFDLVSAGENLSAK